MQKKEKKKKAQVPTWRVARVDIWNINMNKKFNELNHIKHFKIHKLILIFPSPLSPQKYATGVS